jgi:RNA polymerase sigma factor (sigma-70 family)
MSSMSGLGLSFAPDVAAVDERFRGPLMSFFLRRVGSRAEAEDLTQQVFVRLLASQGLSGLRDPAAFVFRIAANLMRDRHRMAVRRGEHLSLDGDGDPALDAIDVELLTPERVLLGKESMKTILQALEELGERTRDIFILFRLENMTHAEIATLFGCSRSTVEKSIMKAGLHLLLKREAR